jgi:hypothetical protein
MTKVIRRMFPANERLRANPFGGAMDQRICSPEIAREMTRRWISDVPSKIV